MKYIEKLKLLCENILGPASEVTVDHSCSNSNDNDEIIH